MFSVIVAHDLLGGTGIAGKLPWPQNKTDMAHFRSTTMKGRIIMGRKTWDSIGKVLPGRENIIVTRQNRNLDNSNFPDNVKLYNDIRQAIDDNWSDKQETFIIGGSEIYKQCFEDPLLYKDMQTIYRTTILEKYQTDCTFPIDKLLNGSDWQLISREQSSEDNAIIERYDRINIEEYSYLSLLNRVLSSGNMASTRTNVNTLSTFAEILRFDLSNNSIPMLTTKQVPFRLSLEEMLFFVSGSTNVQDLRDKNVHIWDGNTTREFLDSRGLGHYEPCDMGPTYSFLFRHAGAEGSYQGCKADYTGQGTDQLQNVIDDLKSDEPNRRIMINLWSAAHLDKMSLPPCLFNYIFKKDIVQKSNGTTVKQVSLMITMRSADLFLGVPFNLVGASLILRMVCHMSGCNAGQICLVMCDAHIYANHIDQVREQVKRRPYRFPRLTILRTPEEIGSIDNFKNTDFRLFGYKSHARISGVMAI